MENEIEVVEKDVNKFERRSPGVVESPPQDALILAIQKNYDPALIEKMMDLQERQKANIAREAFVKAKAAFKSEAPAVIKDMENKQYNSRYASEDALLSTINPVLSRHGLDASFSFPGNGKADMAVCCTLTHELGHSESVTLTGPLDTSGSKNPLQQVKSTVTYLRKATFEAITGITASNPSSDDDGNGAGEKPETISENKVADIETMVTDLIAAKYIKNEADFTARLRRLFRVEKVDDLTEAQGDSLIKKLSAIK